MHNSVLYCIVLVVVY